MFEIREEVVLKDILIELGYEEEKINVKNLKLNGTPGDFDNIYTAIKAGLTKKKYSMDDIRKIIMCIDEVYAHSISWGYHSLPLSEVIVNYYIAKHFFAISMETCGGGFDVYEVTENLGDSDFYGMQIRSLFFIYKYIDRVILNKKGDKILMLYSPLKCT